MLYEPDKTTRLRSDAIGATTLGFRTVETLPNPLGMVLVVRFRNGDRLLHDGASEIDDLMPLIDTLNKSLVDTMTTSETSLSTASGPADRDTVAKRLHAALVAATGRLADPSDLTFDEAHLNDETALIAAINELLTRKPHLASRWVAGDVGQGAIGSATAVDLAGLLRRNAS